MWNESRFNQRALMPQISISELIATGVALSASEAVTLALAVADVLGERRVAMLPPDHQLFLSSTGQVSFESLTVWTDQDDRARTSVDITAQLASLIRRLLQLDEPGSGDRRHRVPGGLLVLLARSLQQIDLPPLELNAFRTAMARFAATDTSV